MALTYADIKKWGLARLSDVAGGTAGVASFNTRTGAVTATTADLTDSSAAGRALVTAADVAAQRTALGLGTAATQATGAFATAAQGAKADTALQTAPVSSVAGRTGAVTLTQADVASNAPVALTAATNLTAATHGNRQITFTGASATLSVTNDATGGWAADEEIIVQTLAGSAGVPTLSTPDGKSIAGSVNQPVGAKRKGANSWDVYLLPQTVGGGSGNASKNSFTPFMFNALAVPTFQNSGILTYGFGAPVVTGTAAGGAIGSTPATQIPRITYTTASAANVASGAYIQTPFLLGVSNRQRVVIVGGIGDSLGAGTRFYMGIGGTFGSTNLEPTGNFLGWRIGIGFPSNATTNLQLITAPESGGGTGVDLGSSFPIPTAADQAIYRLEIQYFPASDAGGRRFEWALTELLSGAFASGTVTSPMPTDTSTTRYSFGLQRGTASTAGSPVATFYGMAAGLFTSWVS